ncbi:MAG: DNA-directed RNA polymerase subunit A' [Thaumarchaeota archaeon]|nr:DNA-directed RNA polymerase subunit A' [Candidatus Calditenuaceae archaeon]MDW8186993.1 DNA-directed RNA polymerase subunit A' [Nitrososphaerota archaeon]
MVKGSIAAIKFGLLSPEMIRSMAVADISNPETYDEDGAPIPTGVMDPRLGTLEPGQRCKTCGNTYLNCPGHFGYIDLAVPVIHIGYVKVIHELLRSTCRSCGRLLITEEQIAKYKAEVERLKAENRQYRHVFYRVKQIAMSTNVCPHCGERQVKVELEKPMTFYESTAQGMARLTANVVRQRLEKIQDSDLELLDMDPQSARPEWMVLTVLPVPPVYVRPSITLETGYRSEDDLTHKLVDILRVNQRLRDAIASGAPSPVIIELSDLLQYHVTTYINNEVPNLAPAQHRSGRILKTLSQRLKGKEGRFRLNLSGKRVDFSARTVISPDPNIDIDEVGVPIEIAMQLTVPEAVTPWNKEKLKELVRNGPYKYPGVRYVIRPDKRIIRLKFVQDLNELADQLDIGWVVERHLMDGDIVLFNRQPSLHRISIMAHRVKVLPFKTFRLNLMVCTPYNADFDGDEMNLHVPQSEEAQAEARLLLQVQRNIISPRYGAPIIGAIRDFLTSSYLLTAKAELDKQMVGYLLAAAGYSGPLSSPKGSGGRWKGAQIFGLLLPPGLNYEGQASFNPDDKVVVRGGELVEGYADKALIGVERPNSLLHRIARDYGPDEVARFLNSLIRLSNTYINYRSFTLSIEDLTVPPRLYEEKAKLIEFMEREYQSLWKSYVEGTIEVGPGQTPERAFEGHLLELLSKVRDRIGSTIRKHFPTTNPIVVMARAGARGSSLNIDQMTAIVGQQAVRRERPSRGFTDRVLPHFRPGDLSPPARGFVYNAFITGLDPIEFFFHMMGGRDGLVDTAVRTQQSGYMQRRLINALESLYVEFDGSVRASDTKRIVQFLYGEDGVDPAKSDHGMPFTPSVIVSRVLSESKPSSQPATDEEIERIASGYRELLPPKWLEELVKATRSRRVPVDALEQVFRLAYQAYLQSLVEVGDPVGIVAAQSIGEPGTQLTLRTFHFAGVREQSILLGLPRLIEIVDARREPSTPLMRVYLKPPHNSDPRLAKLVARNIQSTYLKDLVTSFSVDLRRGQLVMKLDLETMKELGVTKKNLETSLKQYSPQVLERELRITIPKDHLADVTSFRENVLSVKIKGLKRIAKAIVKREGEEYYIETEGSNLKEMLGVSEVDFTRIRTNDIHEVAEVLGIEAARALIIDEITNVLKEQGLDVDVRHIMLVADMMTVDGTVKQIGRHGVVRLKSSVLAKAAFEISVQTLLEAAMRGETDYLRSSVERILMGKEVPVGTGMVQLLMKYVPPKQLAESEEQQSGAS